MSRIQRAQRKKTDKDFPAVVDGDHIDIKHYQFIIKYAQPHEEPQIRAYLETLAKRQKLDTWLVGGKVPPINLEEVFHPRALKAAEDAILADPAMSCILDIFKNVAQRTADATNVTKLLGSPQGVALANCIQKVIILGDGLKVSVAPEKLIAAYARTISSAAQAAPLLNPGHVDIIRNATSHEEVANFRTWLTRELFGMKLTEEQHATFLREVRKKTQQLQDSGVPTPDAGSDPATAQVIRATQGGIHVGGAPAMSSRGMPPLADTARTPLPRRHGTTALDRVTCETSARTSRATARRVPPHGLQPELLPRRNPPGYPTPRRRD